MASRGPVRKDTKGKAPARNRIAGKATARPSLNPQGEGNRRNGRTTNPSSQQKQNTATITKGKTKQNPKKELAVVQKRRLECQAAVVIQKNARVFISRMKLSRLRKEKEDFDLLMEQLQKEAWLEMINAERENREKEERREAEERRSRKEQKAREKLMLEAAFDGEMKTVMELLEQVEALARDTMTDTDHALSDVKLHKAKNALIDCCDANSNTPLSEAAAGRQLDTAAFLISNGAQVNSTGAFQRTPLYRASFAGGDDVVKLLLDNGADPRLHDSSGSTPCDVAATPEIEEMLRSWDISTTEKIIEDRRLEVERQREEDCSRQRGNIDRVEACLEEAEKVQRVCQLKLKKCYQELHKRTIEHDKCFQSSKADITLQSLNDAEKAVCEAKHKETEARTKLVKVQKQLRDITSSLNEEDQSDGKGIKCHIKQLNDVLLKDSTSAIQDSGRWPIVVDSSNLSVTFLRYSDTNYLNALNARDMDTDALRMALLGGMRFGKPVVVDFMDVNMLPVFEDVCNSIQENLFGALVSKEVLNAQRYLALVRQDDPDDYQPLNFNHGRVNHFKLIFVTKLRTPPVEWLCMFFPVRVAAAEEQ